MAGRLRTALLLFAAAGVVAALGSCREDEQDRILFFEPGVYKGQEDPALSEAQVEELRQRARRQSY